ncbi:MAG: hypothetical protein IKC32_04010 [Clostridia bacterium]|nr:hypothetical protein [Clostridia bacterium]
MTNATPGRGGLTMGKLLLCLIFILVPNFNVLDFLPDLVAYLILARAFGRYAEMVPHFAEARDGFMHLAIISTIKIPASVVMVANMSSGRDIVILFSLVFVTIEIITLLPTIRSAYAALYYLGERGSLSESVTPFSTFGINIKPEALEIITIIYIFVRGALNIIPDAFLLSNEVLEIELALRRAFPIATVICMSLSLLVGIAVSILIYRYAKRIIKTGRTEEVAREIAGEARLREIEKKTSVKRMLFAVTVMLFGSLLTFDVSFENLNNGLNMLPHFLYAFLVIWFGLKHFTDRRHKSGILVSGLCYSAVSAYVQYLSAMFYAVYDFSDLGYLLPADEAYGMIKLFYVVEVVLFAAFALSFALGFSAFITEHTTLGIHTEATETDRRQARRMKIKSFAFAAFPLLILILKCVNVFISGEVRYIPVTTPDQELSHVVTNVAPWFGLVVVIASIAYVFYSYFFINEVKEEIRMKYSTERESF